MQLSKSDYILYLKHPAWLWLKKHDKTKLPPVDDNTQAIFDTGHLFEKYAEQLFPNGLSLGFSSYNEYLNLPFSTKQAIYDGEAMIFQGRFEFGSLTCICDVIEVVDTDTVNLYEIKSSTQVKPEHEQDLAFQLVVLEGCGFTVRNIAVVHVNNEYVRDGDIDIKKLVTITDVTEAVKSKRDETKQSIARALEAMRSPTMPDTSPSHCRLSCIKEWLTVYRTLTPVEPNSIYDLCFADSECIAKLEELGVTRLSDIPDDFPLTEKQGRQVRAIKENKTIIEQDQIKGFLGEWQYPLYFLDYETLSSVVPYFDGTKPYQQIPFQYSLYVLDAPDAELRHTEYLHSGSSNPTESLTEALRRDIGSEGSVVVWNQAFEKSCNTLMGSLFTNNTGFYSAVNERIVDLMIPFSNGWYIDKDFCGSASIKKVLPVLIPELSYEALDIHDGSSAQRLWMECILDGKRESEKEQILTNLTEYCKLDTLAMVRLYEYLSQPNLIEVLALPKVATENA